MRIRTWQAVLLPALVGFLLSLAATPDRDWFSMASLSLAAGVAALSLMAMAAILPLPPGLTRLVSPGYQMRCEEDKRLNGEPQRGPALGMRLRKRNAETTRGPCGPLGFTSP